MGRQDDHGSTIKLHHQATGGTATVNGYDIRKQENDVKRVTGLLTESPGLYEKLSAYEFLEFMGLSTMFQQHST